MYISTHQALLDFCQRAREFDAIAVDTEFLRERTFHPRLCLVQIATPAESVAVDPLVIDDLSPLAELMADESVTKVFHACSQDMEVMLHTVGALPRPIFDTQVAAAFLGERQQISYGALVQTFCGVSLPKTESLTDWSRRPLTDKQIEYAIDDVKYLIVAYTEMMSRLRELAGWTGARRVASAGRRVALSRRSSRAFRKVKRINSCSRHQLGIARELAAWREDRAERRNIRASRSVSDDTLLALVSAIRAREEFRSIRGTDQLGGARCGRARSWAIKRGASCPHDRLPLMVRGHRQISPELESVTDLMYALIRLVSERRAWRPRSLPRAMTWPTTLSIPSRVPCAKAGALSLWARAWTICFPATWDSP